MQNFAFNSVEIIGLIASVLTTSSFAPQVYKAWNSKDVQSISLTMYLVLFVGTILWLIYGIYINSFSIIVANIITTILVFIIIILKLKYRKK